MWIVNWSARKLFHFKIVISLLFAEPFGFWTIGKVIIIRNCLSCNFKPNFSLKMFILETETLIQLFWFHCFVFKTSFKNVFNNINQASSARKTKFKDNIFTLFKLKSFKGQIYYAHVSSMKEALNNGSCKKQSRNCFPQKTAIHFKGAN